MQKIIQINIAGRLVPIEENAFAQLNQYIKSLENQYAKEQGGEEILNDIEDRIGELFAMRLATGAHSISRLDVAKVMETLGSPSDFDNSNANTAGYQTLPTLKTAKKRGDFRRLFRNPDDKFIGGVCSGLGTYFGIDPLLIRLIWGSLALIGIGVVAYIVAWLLIPEASNTYEVAQMNNGDSVGLHDLARNVGDEMKDLQKRAKVMTQDLQGFFRRK